MMEFLLHDGLNGILSEEKRVDGWMDGWTEGVFETFLLRDDDDDERHGARNLGRRGKWAPGDGGETAATIHIRVSTAAR